MCPYHINSLVVTFFALLRTSAFYMKFKSSKHSVKSFSHQLDYQFAADLKVADKIEFEGSLRNIASKNSDILRRYTWRFSSLQLRPFFSPTDLTYLAGRIG